MTEEYRLRYSLVMLTIHSPSQARTASGTTRREMSWTVDTMKDAAGVGVKLNMNLALSLNAYMISCHVRILHAYSDDP